MNTTYTELLFAASLPSCSLFVRTIVRYEIIRGPWYGVKSKLSRKIIYIELTCIMIARKLFIE
jgi:hypothetical protein